MSDFSLVMTWAVALIAYIMWIIYVDKPRRGTVLWINVTSMILLVVLSVVTVWLYIVVLSIEIC